MPHRAGCEAPSSLRGCDPQCLSMRNYAPVEHCAAEAFILHREIVLTIKASFTLRAHLMSKDTRKSAMKTSFTLRAYLMIKRTVPRRFGITTYCKNTANYHLHIYKNNYRSVLYFTACSFL